jgi:hypothetical protein
MTDMLSKGTGGRWTNVRSDIMDIASEGTGPGGGSRRIGGPCGCAPVLPTRL